jgi:sec-independent protein translocase protein TatA
MFEGLFQPMHIIVIFGLALLVLGPKKLPELGKGLGESIRGFKSAMSAKDEIVKGESKVESKPTASKEVTTQG